MMVRLAVPVSAGNIAVAACMLLAASAGMTAGASEALAGSRYDRSQQPAGSISYGDRKGCYWHRGEYICARYCYWEANGRRYCQERAWLAIPTGGRHVRSYPPEPPIYVRPPHRRP